MQGGEEGRRGGGEEGRRGGGAWPNALRGYWVVDSQSLSA